MSIALTSRLAFHATTGDREAQAETLLHLYERKGALSDREACYLLQWEAPSVVSARRNDLVKQGLVGEMGRKKDSYTGKTVNVYGVNNETLGL